jgi:hypothetical protein
MYVTKDLKKLLVRLAQVEKRTMIDEILMLAGKRARFLLPKDKAIESLITSIENRNRRGEVDEKNT